MNKLEKLIDAGYKVKIELSPKFYLTLNNEMPCMKFNSDSIEGAIDLAYTFVEEQKKVVAKVETEKQTTDYKIIIDVPQEQELKINEDILNGEFKTTTTIRLYTDVLGQFKDFAETYKEYKSIDLVSMALLEYIEKYKK
ncbi:hypothetical protein LGK97_06430 [Clostridium sp. CS001]|uniref:hypothetical protein n=1 Tax=Clostridium sp. CS001 TaxID=2880648 RepID=UPI001CF12955|nr:hypothetical protein [Clostridium sp. CS001]MCB2289402.1 hypothetical protein [Clostridium sp. CS001]